MPVTRNLASEPHDLVERGSRFPIKCGRCSTFYQHYASMEDLLLDLVGSRFTETGIFDFPLDQTDFTAPNPPDFVVRLAKYVTSRTTIYWDRVPVSGRHSLMMQFMDSMCSVFSRIAEDPNSALRADTHSLRICALAGATTGVVSHWLRDDNPGDAQEIAEWLWLLIRTAYLSGNDVEGYSRALGG